MLLSEAKQWLSDKGYVQTGYWLCFMPPNIIEYTHPVTQSRAELDEMNNGGFNIDGKPLTNDETLSLFRNLIESKTKSC